MKGHWSRPFSHSISTLLTSKNGTTSLQGTQWLVPKCSSTVSETLPQLNNPFRPSQGSNIIIVTYSTSKLPMYPGVKCRMYNAAKNSSFPAQNEKRTGCKGKITHSISLPCCFSWAYKIPNFNICCLIRDFLPLLSSGNLGQVNV